MQTGAPDTFAHSTQGSILVAESGLSLYFFANDVEGQSACLGAEDDPAGGTNDPESCAGVWPPLLAADSAQALPDSQDMHQWQMVTRNDGTQQWAYLGYPVYLYSGDSAQGDINGEGINNVWHLARPTPVKQAQVGGLSSQVANGTVRTLSLSGDALETVRQEKDGFSLYLFDNDPIATSTCTSESCMGNWPPLIADAQAKAEAELTLEVQDNEFVQWSFRGKPLYLFSGDQQPGEANGDGVANLWHLATLEPAIMRTQEDSTRLSATGLVQIATSDMTPTQMDKDQFTLYTFDNDEQLISNCSGDCLDNWPAFLAKEGDEDIGAFSRFDRGEGLMQWAYQGMPLYFFAGDSQKGQANGDGVGGVWHAVQPTTQIGEEDATLGATLTVQGTVSVLLNNGDDSFSAQLQDKSGFQLYTFDNDTEGTSLCTSLSCMNNWPALLAQAGDQATAPYSIFTRADGLDQWAINGKPLYFFAGDESAADTNGEAVGSVWWAARPTPVRVRNHEAHGPGLVSTPGVLPSQGHSADDLEGLSLYFFLEDTQGSGESTCFTGCVNVWPPLYASSSDQAFGEFEIIERTESGGEQTLQWTYKGWPLYFYIGDSQPGDVTGVYGTWVIAQP
ncbi:hypothetical protein [Bowmanella dokdonensis]|uniref:Lipoprotein n=1 Tax=Bowmanella dokdonensis TaxID=751969 RepID=A0A939DMW8_9ALTE|nr:hypothetical protein [Bowmanella dokdonensis]MBN7825428.1 hypothetical protein [Bowmanella dokdonensis]